jgi:hypothetical protein
MLLKLEKLMTSFRKTIGRPRRTKCEEQYKKKQMERENDGRFKRFEFTDQQEKQILECAKCMLNYKEIASIMNVSVDTLKRRAAHLIKRGWDYGRLSLRRLQFQHAEKSWAMAIWLGKQYLDQFEPMPKAQEQDSSDLKKFLELHNKSHNL